MIAFMSYCYINTTLSHNFAKEWNTLPGSVFPEKYYLFLLDSRFPNSLSLPVQAFFLKNAVVGHPRLTSGDIMTEIIHFISTTYLRTMLLLLPPCLCRLSQRQKKKKTKNRFQSSDKIAAPSEQLYRGQGANYFIYKTKFISFFRIS